MFMLKSRKFWVSIVGLAVAFGLLEANDVANEELVQSLLVIVSTISYVISVAIEDAGRHSASQVIVTPAPSVVPAPPLRCSLKSLSLRTRARNNSAAQKGRTWMLPLLSGLLGRRESAVLQQCRFTCSIAHTKTTSDVKRKTPTRSALTNSKSCGS
jgi:hypothetical protein